MATDLTASPEVATTDVQGTTLSGRDFRFLMQGVRQWYRCAACVPDVGEKRERGEAGCLGLLVGGPGIGKTLLLEGLRQACESIGFQHASVACFQGFGPLGGVFHLLRNLAGSTPPECRIRKLESCSSGVLRLFAEYVPELFEGIEADGGLPDDLPNVPPIYQRERTVDLLAQGLIAFATDEPLVLSIDDVAELDTMSTEVLASCLQVTRRRSRFEGGPLLLVVATGRASDVESCEWLARFLNPGYESFRVDLRGYARDDLLDVCESFGLSNATVAERETIFQASSGKPNAVQWILREFTESGLARSSLTQRRISGDVDDLAVDAYQRLEPLERRVVELLSCAGTSLPSKYMIVDADEVARFASEEGIEREAAIVRLELDTLDACARLEKSGWVVRSCHGPDREWRVAVDVPVEPTRRRHIRCRLGQRFLDRDDDVSGRFQAYAYLREGGPAESVTRAGSESIQIAEDLGAYQEALEIRREVLERLDESDADGWSEMARDTAQRLGEWGRVRDAVTIFEDLLERVGSVIGAATTAAVTAEIGALRGALGDLEREDRMYREAIALLSDDEGSGDRMLLLAKRARFLAETGATEDARDELRDVCRLVDGADSENDDETLAPGSVRVEVERHLAQAAYSSGDYQEAIKRRECQSLRAAAIGDIFGQLEAAERLGQLHLLQGQADLALDYFRDALEFASETGARLLEARLQAQVAGVLLGKGETRLARESFIVARDTYLELDRIDDTRDLQRTLSYLSFVHEELDEGLDALEAYASLADETGSDADAVLPRRVDGKAERGREVQRLRKLLKKGSSDSREALLLRLGDCLVDSGEMDAAGRLYQKSMRARDAFRNPIDMALVLQRLGRWYRLRGEHAQALQFYEKSLERLGPVPEKGLVGQAYIEVGDILRVQGDLSKGWEYLLRGSRCFQELDHHRGELVALLAIARFLRDVGAREWSCRVCSCVVELAQRRSDRGSLGNANLLLGVLQSEAGEFAQSDRSFGVAEAIFEENGLLRERTDLDLERGWHNLRQKDFSEAHAKARECLERARQLRSQDLLDDALHLLGAVESVLDNRNSNIIRAVTALQQALEGARQKQRTLIARWLLASLGRLYGDLGKGEVARQYQAEELALTDRLRQRVPTVFWKSFEKESTRRVCRNELGTGKRTAATSTNSR